MLRWLVPVLLSLSLALSPYAFAQMFAQQRDILFSTDCAAATVTLPFCRQGSGATLATYCASGGSYDTCVGGGGGGDALVSNPLSQFAATTSAQLAATLSNETGTGVAAFATSPTFTTDIRAPLVIGGTAAGSALTLQSTNSGAPSGDVIDINQGGSRIARFATGGLGIGTPAGPVGKLDIRQSGVTNSFYARYTQDNDYAGGSGAGVNLNANTYYTAINTGSPFNASHAVVYGDLHYGLKSDLTTLVSTTTGTTTVDSLHHTIYAQGDQESEYNALYAGVRFNIGTGYSPGACPGAACGQTAGPAGGLFALADFNVKGPIGVQPGLLNVQMNYINNYYNGQPSRGSAESGGVWIVTGFQKGGEDDALHDAATTYPVAVGLGIAGTSGSALPGATAGFTTGIRVGGAGGPWGIAGAVDSSIIGTGLEVRDYQTYGAHFHTTISSAPAIFVASTGGKVQVDTSVQTPTIVGGTAVGSDLTLQSTTGVGDGTDTILFKVGNNGATTSATIAAVSSVPGAWGIGIAPSSLGRFYVFNGNSAFTAAAAIQAASGASTHNAIGVYALTDGSHASGTATVLTGLRADVQHSGAGDATIMAAVRTFATHAGAGTVADQFGLWAAANTCAAGTCTRSGGLYLAAQTVGTTPYQIYSVGTAKSYFAGMIQVDMPAAQTIADTNTITADACSGLKRVTSAGAVTTNTTNTFTAPAATNSGCVMSVCNVGSNNIVLDNNANFKSAAGADITLTADDCVTVGSTGASGVWYQLTTLVAN